MTATKRLLTSLALAAALVLAAAPLCRAAEEGKGTMEKGKFLNLARVVEADIIATHAYQVKLARQAGLGEAPCWQTPLSDGELDALVEHQENLLAADPQALKAWASGAGSGFDPAADLEPLLAAGIELAPGLPVQVVTEYLDSATGAPRAEVRAVASLYQTVMEVDRDGTLLQDEMKFFAALGLPLYAGQFGLPGTNEDFLAAGRVLAPATCEGPFETGAAAWQIAARKIWNWGEKHLGIRDKNVVAEEMIEGELADLLPALREMPPQKIAVVGHSYTMDLHWSSPSAFVPIAASVLERVNPDVEVRQWERGGLNAAPARERFYDEVLAWGPDEVFFVVEMETEADARALAEMTAGLRESGAHVYSFDDFREPVVQSRRADRQGPAREAGLEIIEVAGVIESAPESEDFLCLDGIHMREPYHRLMAAQWLEFLAGERGLELGE